MPTAESGEPFPPGFCHFPQLGEEFFRQLTAEHLITRLVKGYRRPEWIKTRERNEALDTRIYARAAAAQFGIDRFNENHWRMLEAQVAKSVESLEPPAAIQTAPPPQMTANPVPESRPAPARRII